jgi:hypothetical protein
MEYNSVPEKYKDWFIPVVTQDEVVEKRKK